MELYDLKTAKSDSWYGDLEKKVLKKDIYGPMEQKFIKQGIELVGALDEES